MIKGFIRRRLVPGLEADALTRIRTVPGVADRAGDAVVQPRRLSRLVVGQIRGIQRRPGSETLVATEIRGEE